MVVLVMPNAPPDRADYGASRRGSKVYNPRKFYERQSAPTPRLLAAILPRRTPKLLCAPETASPLLPPPYEGFLIMKRGPCAGGAALQRSQGRCRQKKREKNGAVHTDG